MTSAFPSGTRTIVAVIGAHLLRGVIRCVQFIQQEELRTMTGSWARGREGLALARATIVVPNRRIVPLARRSREPRYFFCPHIAAKELT